MPLLLLVLICLVALSESAVAQSFPFTIQKTSEVVADLEMSSPGSDWSKPGREAALATLTLDGLGIQHVMLYDGERKHTYQAFLGSLGPGRHLLVIERHPKYSAAGSRLLIHGASFREVPSEDPYWKLLSRAPVLYARADTIGLFTDVPLIAFCEQLTEEGKPLVQYTTIFSNEDGGTSTRALMARWGRATDIEYIYKGWLDAKGDITRATIQGKDHKEIEFDGTYEDTHPVLIPSTTNNMVSGQGTSPIRYQIPPLAIDLGSHSREIVMDDRPYSYRVMAQELERENKLRPYGTVRAETISDPRNYLFIEAKAVLVNSALGLLVHLKDEPESRTSYLGQVDLGIRRDGWFRSTVELPPGTRPQQIAEIGFECLVPAMDPEPASRSCHVDALSKAFFLSSDYIPQPSIISHTEDFDLASGKKRFFPLQP